MSKEKKKKKEKKSKEEERLEEEKIAKIVKRLESEEVVKERVEVEARLIPSTDPDTANVKIKLKILDDSFYAKGATVFYNAGTENFEDVEMEKVDMDNFAIILNNVPKEIQIIYYIKIKDKSGALQQFPRPELIQKDGTSEEEPYFSFSVEPDGSLSFKKEWDDSGLVKCGVCGYACLPSWDNCPECRTPIYDTFQEVFADEQKAKLEARKQVKQQAEEGNWEDASDDIWRGLPECPNCGYVVQLEWQKCPVCQFDLSTVELKKKESYEEFMTEEEKEEAAKMSEISKRKQKIKKNLKDAKKESEEPTWEDEEGVDVL